MKTFAANLLLFLLSFIIFPFSALAISVQYSYDAQMRLVRAKYASGAEKVFSYDATGNMLEASGAGELSHTYEDGEGEGTTGWDVYDNIPAGASITKVFDSDRSSNVVQFVGSGTENGYRLRNADGSYWNDTEASIIEWSMKYSEAFVVYIAVQTTKGFRYIYYTPKENSVLGDGTYIHYGLGSQLIDGNWHTIVRDLSYDLKQAQPGNELLAVLGFLIRGSGMVDDIKTRSDLPTDLDSDGDGLSDMDEITNSTTNPYTNDSDGDGISDKEERDYWGSNWNADSDGDGLINLLDPDSDNDGFSDGLERSQGTDPADPASQPIEIVYEDAENGDTVGWDIYDADPSGATISNILDSTRGSRVIETLGDAKGNGYRLRDANGGNWDDKMFKIFAWSMSFEEPFVVYVAVQTKAGFRYLYYTEADHDGLGESTYIHHGLVSVMLDGKWHNIIRDLSYDLKQAQPDNEIESIEAFLVRGTGRVDDIKSLKELPVNLDSDADGLTDLQEMELYATLPYASDSDKDGIDDKTELDFWGTNWNRDADGDGLVNILDADADNDGFSDGVERAQGTDPASASSMPESISYEDGEGSGTSGWDIYDADPAGASIAKVYDNTRGSNVVQLTGNGTENGYRLRKENGENWDDAHFNAINWSMNFNESFVVYVAVQTKDGFRYLYYTPKDSSALGDSTYIHHGLGSHLVDGTWHDISRNLELDLKEAQPSNELSSILGFYVRGTGKVDDIKTTGK